MVKEERAAGCGVLWTSGNVESLGEGAGSLAARACIVTQKKRPSVSVMLV